MHFKEIIDAIKARRKSLQVSQEVVAELSGVSLRTLKKFEAGKGNPTISNLKKIVRHVGFGNQINRKKYQGITG